MIFSIVVAYIAVSAFLGVCIAIDWMHRTARSSLTGAGSLIQAGGLKLGQFLLRWLIHARRN